MSDKIILRLLYGGKSAEHEVSLQTALSVINALDKDKYDVLPVYISPQGEWICGPRLTTFVEREDDLIFSNEREDDRNKTSLLLPNISENEIVFPLLHGPNGEDGTVQGLLELLNVPYVGNGVASSAVGMDKVFMKQIFAQHDLAQPRFCFYVKKDWQSQPNLIYETIEKKLGFPCFVKPANLGSSVGINKCRNRGELHHAFEVAFRFDHKVIVEEGIDGREIEVGLLGNDDPSCSVAGEIVPNEDFYDYHAKYKDGSTSLIIPADISKEVYERMKSMAIKAFKAIDGSGLVRADFFVTNSGHVLINEINTMPGFTPFSMFPLLWKHSGVEYPQLIERLIRLGMERYEEKQQIRHTMD